MPASGRARQPGEKALIGEAFMRRIGFALAATLALSTIPVLAQQGQFPNRTIRIISPAPPGGSTDIVSRLVQPALQEALKQTVIVEAKGGAGGYIGSEYVSKQPADGHTLLLGGAFTAITASLQKTPSYDPLKDLVPIAIVASVPNLLVAGPRLKANSVAELVAQAKARPGDLNFGSNGVGTTIHLTGELFKLRTGINIVHIGYKGWADCVRGLLGGEVDMMFDNLSSALPNISAGKTRPLAVAASQRHRSLPDVPTFEEVGVKDAEVTSFFGIMAPAATPQPVIDRIGEVLKNQAANPEFQKLVQQQGLDVDFRDPMEAGKFWRAEVAKWRAVIKSSGLAPQ